MHFHALKKAIAANFAAMQKGQLFRVNVNKDELWNTYLDSFPAGTNEIFRERREYDCNCCKQFVRAVGNVVAVVNGKVTSIWEVTVKDEPNFQIVVDAMAKYVKAGVLLDTNGQPLVNSDGVATGETGDRPIANYFLHYENKAGTDRNFDNLLIDGKTKEWEHFFVNIDRKFVKANRDIATTLGENRAHRDVFDRGLREIKPDAIQTVQELINSNTILRGSQYKFMVDEFAKQSRKYHQLSADEQKTYAWEHALTLDGSVTKILNSSIGTLLDDLSNDVDLEVAVAKYEDKVNGGSYKRTTALVSKKMIENAKKALVDAGLISATYRRHATVRDLPVGSMLYVDRTTRNIIAGDAFDELLADTSSKVDAKKLNGVQEMSIEAFLRDVVPTSTSIELLLDNENANKMVSLITAEDPTSGQLFKWNNQFSWSYKGELADTIKERVKQAGGSVVGDLCCRLAWYNHDDLDLHMHEPDGGHIYYGSRGTKSRCGGMLDVDMNAGYGSTRTPVENIFYASKKTMKEGVYELKVNNFSCRDFNKDVGFDVEIDFMGTRYSFAYPRAVANRATITVAKFKYTHANGIEFLDGGLTSAQATKTVWGLTTQTFHKVNALMLSPNFWDDNAVGNKHYFFMLEGCANDDSARGFYNEFLKQDLDKHRKVLELIGSKTKVVDATDQLSGVGFSSTQRASATVRVKGSFTRTLKVVF